MGTHEQAQSVAEAGRPDGRGDFAQAARGFATRQGYQRGCRARPDESAETDGFVAWPYPQSVQFSAPPYQLGRNHVIADLPGKRAELVPPVIGEMDAVKAPPRDIVGTCLDEIAKIGRGKSAGQRP